MSECQHEWKFQQDYSKAGSIRRFTCLKCGCWGYNQPPSHWNDYKEKPIRAYTGERTEPDPTWRQNRKRHPDPPERPRQAEFQYAQDTCPTNTEMAVYGAARFVDPGEC